MERQINLLAKIDWFTVSLYFLLIFMGWFNIYAAVYNEDHSSIFDFSQRYGKQLIWIGFAVAFAIIFFLLDGKFYSIFAYIIYGLLLILLITVIFMSREIHGAKSWFEIGSLSFQPAEFAKFSTALALAKFMSSYNFKLWTVRSISIAAAIIFTPFILIILQNDTGSALVYSAFIFVLYREGLPGWVLVLALYIAVLFILSLLVENFILLLGLIVFALAIFGLYWKKIKQVVVGTILISLGIMFMWAIDRLFKLNLSYYLIISVGFIIALLPIIIWALRFKVSFVYFLSLILIGSILFTFSVDYFFFQILEPHQRTRINVTLGIEQDPKGAGYHVNQSKIAIGSGGIWGKGFLQGTQTKLDFIPEQSTDFIFCTVGEEWGFIGTSVVIILFVVLLLRLIFLAERQKSKFSRIYGYGVASIIFFHLVINIGMTIGLLPVIGIPLPFFSYGGSSLWAFTILLFIFIRLDGNRTMLL